MPRWTRPIRPRWSGSCRVARALPLVSRRRQAHTRRDIEHHQATEGRGAYPISRRPVSMHTAMSALMLSDPLAMAPL